MLKGVLTRRIKRRGCTTYVGRCRVGLCISLRISDGSNFHRTRPLMTMMMITCDQTDMSKQCSVEVNERLKSWIHTSKLLLSHDIR